jgi:hypothetical protein
MWEAADALSPFFPFVETKQTKAFLLLLCTLDHLTNSHLWL